MTEHETPYAQHERLLRQLHDLNRAGKLDSAEADALRDEMDPSWSALSVEERARLAQLSEDLYLEAEKGKS